MDPFHRTLFSCIPPLPTAQPHFSPQAQGWGQSYNYEWLRMASRFLSIANGQQIPPPWVCESPPKHTWFGWLGWLLGWFTVAIYDEHLWNHYRSMLQSSLSGKDVWYTVYVHMCVCAFCHPMWNWKTRTNYFCHQYYRAKSYDYPILRCFKYVNIPCSIPSFRMHAMILFILWSIITGMIQQPCFDFSCIGICEQVLGDIYSKVRIPNKEMDRSTWRKSDWKLMGTLMWNGKHTLKTWCPFTSFWRIPTKSRNYIW